MSPIKRCPPRTKIKARKKPQPQKIQFFLQFNKSKTIQVFRKKGMASCKINSKKHYNGIIEIEYWTEQVKTYFSEKNTILRQCFDCRLGTVQLLQKEARFFIEGLSAKDFKDMKSLENEISMRFPSCQLLKYNEEDARNSVVPHSFPEYYICVPEKAQQILNSRIKFQDTFWAVVETKTPWICMGLFFVLILLIYLLQKHIENYETPNHFI